ncbi:MAG: glycosyltransferase [Candidatus Omnitrophica bacterium]|jgi:glycosyltransferase involved in cell wall biosynthesis|nr:glycosyltransferase [Candidatus Omnitrophota bacterium]
MPKKSSIRAEDYNLVSSTRNEKVSTDAIAIIIPCYNEEKRLKRDAFVDELSNYSNLTFLFVNDGSKDNTLSVIQKICTVNPERALCFSLEANKGKAEAVRQGMLYLLEKDKYDIIGFWDADLAVPLSEIWDFVEIFKKNSNIKAVIGSRVHLAGRSIERVHLRHYFGRLFATVVDLTFDIHVYDTQCGAKLFDSRILAAVAREPFCSRWIFDVEIIIRISRLIGTRDWLYEVPVEEWKNISGTKRSISAYTQALFDYMSLMMEYRR